MSHNPFFGLHEEDMNSVAFFIKQDLLKYGDNVDKLREIFNLYLEQWDKLDYESQDRVLDILTRLGELERKRPPRVEDGWFKCARFSWPIEYIERDGFEYWWNNVVVNLGQESNLNKISIYTLIRAHSPRL